jgi:hypothetical protein
MFTIIRKIRSIDAPTAPCVNTFAGKEIFWNNTLRTFIETRNNLRAHFVILNLNRIKIASPHKRSS